MSHASPTSDARQPFHRTLGLPGARLVCTCVILAWAGLAGCDSDKRSPSQSRDPATGRRHYSADITDEANRPSPGAQSATYMAIRGRHYLTKVLEEGSLLILEDGSLWRVDPSDLIYSVAWVPFADIVVSDLETAPHYRLVNANAREQVAATYLGTPQ